MKKIYTLLMLAFCIFTVGCSDDEDVVTDTLKVISTDAQFTYEGGTGIIKVSALSGIEASSSESWCKVAVSGMDINVTVETNNSISSRTAMVTIQSGSEVTKVPITQMGDTFICDLEDISFPARGGSAEFTLKTIREVEIETPSWITYQRNGDKIVFAAAAVPNAVYRNDLVKIKAGGATYTATFSQIQVAGLYDLTYQSSDGKETGLWQLEATDSESIYMVTTSGMPIDASFQIMFKDGKLLLPCGQLLGKLGSLFVYLTAYNAKGYFNNSNSVQYAAEMTPAGDGKLSFAFHDNGTWSPDYSVDGLFYAHYDKQTGGAFKGGYPATDVVLISK